MDLLCNENIRTDCENETTTCCKQVHMEQCQLKEFVVMVPVTSSGSSPCSGCSFSLPSPGSASSSSSGYHSGASNHRHQVHPERHSNTVHPKDGFSRNLDYVNNAAKDPTFLTDLCLQNALKMEQKRLQPLYGYFRTVQKDITPPMRKIVAEWMMEVCAEEKCQEEVVLLALNYMDRFLALNSVKKTHLQILAAACLLLASKLREPSCRALSAELLVFYTDNSILKDDLIKWELLVLSRLGWDLSTVTPLDFLELLLVRLPIANSKCPDITIERVRQHAQAFIALAAKEHNFLRFSASTVAAASIVTALVGLNWHWHTNQNPHHLLNRLNTLINVTEETIHQCMLNMESSFEEQSRTLQPNLVDVEVQQQEYKHSESKVEAQDVKGEQHSYHNTGKSVILSDISHEKCGI